MKRFLLFPIFLLALALGANLSAQNLSGISIEAESQPIVVYVDNTQVCKPTFSCYVVLPRGTYRIRVEAVSGFVFSSQHVVYERNIYFSGYGTEYIDVERYLSSRHRRPKDWSDFGQSHRDRSFRTNSKGFELRPITQESYQAFVERLKDCSFASDVKKLMTLFPVDAGISAWQFQELCSIPSFDDSRLIVARVLVAQILDLKNCENWKTPFTFLSTQDEVRQLLRREFEFRYDSTHYPSFLW